MRLGPYSVKLKIVKVDNRPLPARWPWLQRWTGYKCLALFFTAVGLLMIYGVVVTSQQGSTNWLFLIQAVSWPCAAIACYKAHRATLKWRSQNPGYYNQPSYW